MAQYSILYNNVEVGPMPIEYLRNYGVRPDSMIRVDGGPWVRAFTVPEVMGVISQTPPPYYGAANGPAQVYTKDRVTTGVLALLLGALGVQYFYLGKIAAGLISILLTLVTCGLWEIFTFVQGIIILTMTDADFQRKFVNNPATMPML